MELRHIGITGTRSGGTPEQQAMLKKLMGNLHRDRSSSHPDGYVENTSTTFCFHHGDCIGVDQLAHETAVEQGWTTHVHPPIKNEVRAMCEGDEMSPPKGYFARNRDIVDSCSVLIAVPPCDEDPGRGGTWYTINYARKVGTTVIMIPQNGVLDV